MRTLDKLVLRDWALSHADDASDKEGRGQVLVVTGSREIPGVALLSATAALGTSGLGDVLASIMAGLAARGAPLEQAAAWGMVLHALSGKRLADRQGWLGFLACEIRPKFRRSCRAFETLQAQESMNTSYGQILCIRHTSVGPVDKVGLPVEIPRPHNLRIPHASKHQRLPGRQKPRTHENRRPWPNHRQSASQEKFGQFPDWPPKARREENHALR